MPEANQAISNEQILALLENASLRTPAVLDPGRSQALVWLALAPAWPESLAVQGFPGGTGTMVTGPPGVEFLLELVRDGLAISGPGEPPLAGRWYWMEDGQRRSVISAVLANPKQGIKFLEDELRASAGAMQQALSDAVAPPALTRWLTLAQAPDPVRMGEQIGERVGAAIDASANAGGLYSAEAAAWAEAAEPLADIFGGPVEVALAGAQRRLELYRRDARDLRYLKNYFARKDQESAFEELIATGDNPAWALHYAGMGGIGKTMLVRRIRTGLAREKRLAVGHVDFDQLNPDYPRRAPGLLLQSLASDLRLNDDPSVAKLFAVFDQEIQNAHRRLQGRYQDSGQADSQAPDGIRNAVGFFIEALRQIWRQGLRPLLILDTCEELARMRLDRTIPENLRFTFDLVEQIYDGIPELRVVFSGRRALAASGAGWKWPGCTLPERKYLRLFEIVPFYEDEATEFLHRYERDNQRVPDGIVEAILKQSRVKHASTEAASWSSRVQWADADSHAPRPGELYYPFDLDLFARWACSPDGLDEKKLLEGGAHYYVKERIVDRIGPILRPWLADLVLLGRFDQKLIQELTGYSDRYIGNFWKAIVDQEWTELDRNAQAEEVWSMDAHLRERLLEYYREEDSLSLESSRARVAGLLKRVTLNRAFKDLSPAHFEVCLQVLATKPQQAALWWNEVEARIAREERWDWANELAATLLVNTTVDSPMYAAILALQAAAQLHLSPERAYTSWSDVLAGCKNYPDPAARERLRFRAEAGLVIAKTKGGVGTSEDTFLSTRTLLKTLRAASADEQLSATVIALVENMIERLESTGKESTGRDSTQKAQLEPLYSEVRALPAAQVWTIPGLSEPLKAFAESLHSRLEFNRVHIDLAQLRAVLLKSEQRWLDWRSPDNLLDRLRLQAILLGDKVGDFPWQRIDNIDTDRLVSAALTEELDSGLQSTPPSDFANPEIPPPFLTSCNAHSAFPPSIAPRIEWIAAHGPPDAAVRLATRLLGDTELPADYRKAVETYLLKVVLRFRLYEEKIAVDSGSMNQRDLNVLAAFLDSLEIKKNVTPRSEVIAMLRDEPIPPQARRRAGENLLLAAMLECTADPVKARESFEAAWRAFSEANDQVGVQLCLIGRVGCDAMLGELAAWSQLDLITDDWKPKGGSVTEWTDWLDASPRALRPWRVRAVACLVRLGEPGDAVKFMSWAGKAYSGQVPDDLRKIVAPPRAVDPFTGFGPVLDKAKPALRQSALGLLGLVVIVGAAYGLYRGWAYLLGRFGLHWGRGWLITSFIVFCLLLLSLPQIGAGFVALMSSALQVRRRVGDRRTPTIEADPLRYPVALNEKVCIAGTRSSFWKERTGTTGPTSFDLPYPTQAAAVSSASLAHLPIENIIEIESSAAAPWEAIFALSKVKSGLYHDQKSMFRREMAPSLAVPSIPSPIPPHSRAVTWRLDTDRISAQVWETALKGRLIHDLEEPIATGTLRRDDSIEILHILGKPIEVNGTLCLQMQRYDSSMATALYTRSILSQAPQTRLCIVQDFPGEPSMRTTSDRYAANVARLFGWQMHSVGIAAVIMIPPLPEALSRTVLAKIAGAVGRFSRRGRHFLFAAVEASRRTISKEGKPDPESASEIACDLVLYSTPEVRLHFGRADDLPERLHMPRSGNGPERPPSSEAPM